MGTFSGSLAWPYLCPFPQRPEGLIEAAFEELARRWRPILDVCDEQGVNLCYEIHPSEDLLVFASWSRGYKTGGWTTRLTNPQGNVAPSFDEEIAETFEIGVKSTLLDRRLQLNVAAFTTNYRDVQLNQQVGTSPTIDNAGTARIRGFEAEAVLAPIDGLTINGAVGYLDLAPPGVLAHWPRLDGDS